MDLTHWRQWTLLVGGDGRRSWAAGPCLDLASEASDARAEAASEARASLVGGGVGAARVRRSAEQIDPRQEIAPTQPKRKFTASLASDETLIVEKKARYIRKQKEKKEASGCEEDEDRRNGVSTELVLLFDPYKIKKKLTKSDLGHLSRL
ncbi:hypothetical protein NL676_008783 [Syzygium grande]|nr:hypothetical protein NL676_008783 [Syzygium grande]